MKSWLIILTIIALTALAGCGGWKLLSEQPEDRKLPHMVDGS